MATHFTLPRQLIYDANGEPISAAYVRFFDAGTSTPRAVYSDDGLLMPIALDDLTTDIAGRLPKIYLGPGAYKVIVYDGDPDVDGVQIYVEDDLDPGVSSTGGVIQVADGGTGASTAAGARTSLGAASQSDLDGVSSDVAAIQAAIDGVGGTLGDLAGKDTVSRTDLAAGFGVVILQRVEVDAETALVSTSSSIPQDNTVPQISEGAEILSGLMTPQSASSRLFVEVDIPLIGTTSAGNAIAALFLNTDAAALAMGGAGLQASSSSNIRFHYDVASPGTSPITWSARIGSNNGVSITLNGIGGSRVGGGVSRANIRVTEYLTV